MNKVYNLVAQYVLGYTSPHTELKEASTLNKVGLTVTCMKRDVAPVCTCPFHMNTLLSINNPAVATA